MALVKIIGVDAPTPNVGKLAQSTNQTSLPDTSQQGLQAMDAAVQSGYNAQRQAIDGIAQIGVAVAQASGKSKFGQDLQGIMETVNAGVKVWNDLEDRKAKEADARRKAQQEQDQASLELRLQDVNMQLQQRVRESGYEQGVGATRRDGEALLAEYAKLLPTPVIAKLRGQFHDTLSSVDKQQTSVYFENAKQYQSAQEGRVEAEMVVKFTPQFQELSIITDPDQAEKKAQELAGAIKGIAYQQAQAQGIQDPSMFALRVYQKVLSGALSQNYTAGAEARAKLEQKLSNTNEYLNGASALAQAVQSGQITESERQVGLAQLSAQTGIDMSMSDKIWKDQASLEQQAIDEAERQQKLENIAIGRQTAQFGGKELSVLQSRDTAQYLYNLINLPATEREVKMQAFKNGNAFQKAAVTAYEQYTKDAEELKAANVKLLQMTREYEQLRSSADPKLLGPRVIQTTDLFGMPSRQTIDPKDIRPGATAAEVQAKLQEIMLFRQQMSGKYSKWTGSGVDLANPTNTQYLDKIKAQAKGIEDHLIQSGQGTRDANGFFKVNQGAGEVRPNFNQGAVGTGQPQAPAVNRQLKYNGVTVPFLTSEKNVQITSGYGNRVHPIHGTTKFHDGIDFVVDNPNGKIGTIAGGKVVEAQPVGGYGNVVTILTPSGHFEMFAHLSRSVVKVGQTIAPGTHIGNMGTTGDSTGEHLHFSVFQRRGNEGIPQAGTSIDPMQYLKTVKVIQQQPRGVGAPPNQPAPGRNGGVIRQAPINSLNLGGRRFLLPSSGGVVSTGLSATSVGSDRLISLGGGKYLKGGRVVMGDGTEVSTQYAPNPSVYNLRTGEAKPASTAISASLPAKNGVLSGHAKDYGPNSPTANYGYSVIAKEPEYAKALAQVSSKYGMPAVWLADLIQFESGHDPHIPNRNGNGALGLIQIMPDTASALGISSSQILRMSRAEYVRKVIDPYLADVFGREGKPKYFTDLIATILQGTKHGNLGPDANGTTVGSYFNAMGAAVGRKYTSESIQRSPAATITHTNFRAGCPICGQMMEQYGKILPHKNGGS